ncbi:[protein-PII] uridylyltransferase [Acidothermaceae bacterium B102]|nr:[protein-PII] uridylyltransferase [Acidothermaceae bacterium B102]
MRGAPTQSDLRQARAELFARSDVRGAELRAQLTQLTDNWLVELLGHEADVALVSVGAYGRREPAVGSDLDLVLLHRGRKDIKALAERLWYPIWDTGIGLDHSVRTLSEALDVADGNLSAASGLLELRHVAGDPVLCAELSDRAHQRWRAAARRRLPELAEVARERAERFGEIAFLLEPDLKEGRGGLRDVQSMRGSAASWAVDAPGREVQEAYAFLLDVRGELHRHARKPTDRLMMQEQIPVAETMGLADADALLRAVSAAARTIAFAADDNWRRVARWLGSHSRRRGKPAPWRPLAAGVLEQDGEVGLARDADPATDAVLPLRAAAAAAQAGLLLSSHALSRLVAAPARLAEPWPDEARDALVALLGSGPAAIPVIESLDQAGLMERWFPEWTAVRSKPQHNPVHRFTVDRHLVEAAVEASAFTRRVSRPDLLLLGALLHDIGKGVPGDHTTTGLVLLEVIAPRLGLVPDDVATIMTLLRHHLLLPTAATRRDLDDPATVRAVAEAVGNRETLMLLAALTEADALATGPAAWGDWKAALVEDLVGRTAAVLGGAPLPSAPPLTAAQLALASGPLPAVGIMALQKLGAYEVTIAAEDARGHLARCAGVLALHRLDVRGATAAAVEGTAISVFTVTPRFGEAPPWEALRADLRRNLQNQLPLGERLAQRDSAYDKGAVAAPQVLFDDDASDTATVLEVRAHDRPGLLYRVAQAIADRGLDVRTARVGTLGAEAVDAFYLVGTDGELVQDPAVRDAVRDAVLSALA